MNSDNQSPDRKWLGVLDARVASGDLFQAVLAEAAQCSKEQSDQRAHLTTSESYALLFRRFDGTTQPIRVLVPAGSDVISHPDDVFVVTSGTRSFRVVRDEAAVFLQAENRFAEGDHHQGTRFYYGAVKYF